MSISVRFAPSPTGRLHIGNIRTALLNWLFARKLGGSFMLRLDDTDRQRSTEEFANGIREDLSWLGLGWDREARQSDRFDRYGEIVERLRAEGRLYACYETPDELDRRRKRQTARGLPPIYDRAGLKLTAGERASLEAEGRKPHWRFLLQNFGRDPGEIRPTAIAWGDLVRGPQSIDIGSLSDPVLVREDGAFLYTLSSVVDDADFSISHVIRGEDHVTNTAVQIEIFRALGATPPEFGHHSLLIGPDGQGLSKRLGALSIRSFRDMGLEAMAVASHAATLGTSGAIAAHQSLDELVKGFDLSRLSRAPARFDVAELAGLNEKLLHGMDYDRTAARLSALGVGGGEAFWLAVRGNLATLADAAQWWQVVAGETDTVIENPVLCARAAELLPAEPWDGDTWSAWCAAVKATTGTKGKELFHPLRLALTGRDAGPEMKLLLPFIGIARAQARLTGRRL